MYKVSNYAVDLVFCIDTTMSMEQYLEKIKNGILRLCDDLKGVMESKNKHIEKFRVKIIGFRDYYYDRDRAMLISDFFEIPNQKNEFVELLSNLNFDGGGDDPEDGLEALAFAMKSDWNNEITLKRHYIFVFSDDDAHDLGYGRVVQAYPDGIPKNFQELSKLWGSGSEIGLMNERAKMLILFTPDMGWWNKIENDWDCAINYRINLDEVWNEDVYKDVLHLIVHRS